MHFDESIRSIMTLFDGKPDMSERVVLSASRMTDMPKYYPKEIIEEVNKRLAKNIKIHTLVLWTKHPRSLLAQPLRIFLTSLKTLEIQLYIQLTISGMGKIVAGKKAESRPFIPEPNAPRAEDSLKALTEIIDLVEKPERIRLRIDPIVRLKDFEGKTFSNLKFFQGIVEFSAKLGVKHFTFSLLQTGIHRKVDMRFKKIGCQIVPPDNNERYNTAIWLTGLEEKYKIKISACSVKGFPESKCIDGELLQQLHDKKYPVSRKQPRKRALCGCTSSIDIGGWPPKKCFTGCDYCYGNSKYSI